MTRRRLWLGLLLTAPLWSARVETLWANEAYDVVAERYRPGRWSALQRSVRTQAVWQIRNVDDARVASLLIDLLRSQMKIAREMTRTWERAETAWSKKTVKLEKPVERDRREAYLAGRTATIGGAARDWMGSTKVTGKMYAAKRNIERIYRDVLAERRLVLAMTDALVVVVSRLEGEARAMGIQRVRDAYRALEDSYRPHFLRSVGTLPDAALEPWFLALADERHRSVASAAHEALGTRTTPTATGALLERLSAVRWQVRAAAIRALRGTRDPAVVDAMMQRATQEVGALTRHYHLAFAAIFGREHARNPVAWSQWWERNREACAGAWRSGRRILKEEVEALPSTALDGSTSFYGIRTNSRHIIFVVDMSSSMKSRGSGTAKRQSRFEAAKQELAQALGSMRDDDGDDAGPASFNIVVFGTFVDVYRADGMVIATADARKKALAWVEKTCLPIGMTNSFDALAAAFDVARRTNARSPGRAAADTIYFMTDAGEPNRGRFFDLRLLLGRVAELNEGRHLTIHAVGVGTSTNLKMLRSLAGQNGGLTTAR